MKLLELLVITIEEAISLIITEFGVEIKINIIYQRSAKKMKIIQLSDVPVLEPAKNGYWEIYDDGSKIWHKNECPQNNKMRLKPPSDYIIPNQDVKTGDLITFLDEGKYK